MDLQNVWFHDVEADHRLIDAHKDGLEELAGN